MKTITIIIFIIFINFIVQPAYAAESSPSADIASKLKEFQKKAASKAAQLKDLISKKLQNKAFIGSIQSQSGNSLTIAAESGPKIVSLNEDTLFESNVKSKQKFSRKNLTSGDYIAALGDADETGVLTAKKIILLPPTNQQPKTYLWGQVISMSDQLVTLRDKDFKNIAASLPESSKFKLNDFVILTGSFNKNNIFDAGFVFVKPQGATLKPKKVATPSAQVTTPSAKPKATSR